MKIRGEKLRVVGERKRTSNGSIMVGKTVGKATAEQSLIMASFSNAIEDDARPSPDSGNPVMVVRHPRSQSKRLAIPNGALQRGGDNNLLGRRWRGPHQDRPRSPLAFIAQRCSQTSLGGRNFARDDAMLRLGY